MITLVQKAVNYFAGNNSDSGKKVERPRLEEFIAVPQAKTETRHFVGRVTSLSKSCIVIEYDIYCDPSILTLERDVELNSQLKGVAERDGKHEAWRVVEAQVVQEEWDDDPTCLNKSQVDGRSGQNGAAGSQGAISCRELAEGIPGILKQDVFSGLQVQQQQQQRTQLNQPKNQPPDKSSDEKNICECSAVKAGDGQCTVIGQVMGVVGDTVTLTSDITFQTSSTVCEFELMEGDWVICKFGETEKEQEQVNPNVTPSVERQQVVSVKALRGKRLRAEVTNQHLNHCILNSEIYCAKSVKGVAGLRRGDRVLAEVIESEQRQLRWRAVCVTPVPSIPSTQELQRLSQHLSSHHPDRKLLQDEENVVISPFLRFPESRISSYVEMKASVENIGSDTKILKKVYFKATVQGSQFAIKSEENSFPISLDSGEETQVTLACKGKWVGEAREICIFDFGDFRIGREVTARITDPLLSQIMSIIPHTPTSQHHHHHTPHPGDTGRLILGERPFHLPTFLPMNLPVAVVPEQLWEAVEMGKQEVVEMVPSLTEPLTPYNHKEKFAALLHLEEIEMTKQMRQFDMERVTFERHGEYLSLCVSGLAERRPSLMVGDTVEAWKPITTSTTSHDTIVYQGYIHQVLNSKVLVKFHPGFHNQYQGEDCSVRCNFNRTPLRRCHFALQFAMTQLGPDVIFPGKLKFQLPQVCYIDLEAPVPPRVTSRSHVNKITLQQQSQQASVSGMNVDKIYLQEPPQVSHVVEIKVNKIQEEETPKTSSCCMKNVDLNSIHTNNTSACDVTMKAIPEKYEEPLTSGKSTIEKKKSCTIGISENVDGSFETRSNFETDEMQEGTEKGKEVGFGCVKVNKPTPTPPQRRKQNLTPPRIPVVARLFGVHSSGSSNNSSMCCSDDDADECGGADRSSDLQAFPVAPAINGNIDRRLSKMEVKRVCEKPQGVNLLFGKDSGTSRNAHGTFDNKEKESSCSVAVNTTKRLTWHMSNVDDRCEPKLKHTTTSSAKLPQIITPNGKTLFIPRTLELAYYKNIAVKKDVRERETAASPIPEKEVDENEEKDQDSKNLDSIVLSEGQGIPISVPECITVSKEVREEESKGRRDDRQDVAMAGKEENAHRRKGEVHNNNETHSHRKDCNCRVKPLAEYHQKTRQQPSSHTRLHKFGYITPVLPVRPDRSKGVNASLPTLRWFNKNLNSEQKLAVRRILEGTTRPLPYIIYGPPGTGKTVTVVETALQILTLVPDSRVLVVTPSNSASDLVAEHLVRSGGLGPADLLRLNAYQRSEESIPAVLQPHSETGDGLGSGAAMRRVTAATATTAGLLYTLNLHSHHYTHILIDEAGQLTEPETLLVMGLVNHVSGQVVLAGDPQQLGPVVMSRVARSFGLQQSLLHRLCQSVLYQPKEEGDVWYYEPSLVTQLIHNYRSHPHILSLPSKLFYNDTLRHAADLKPLEYLLGWGELIRPGYPLLFHGIIGENMQEGDSPSWFNPAEAFQVVRYSKSLVGFGVAAKDIGIITPYRKQVEKILKLLGTFGVPSGVKVGSVEEFQGQERQVVLISTVRSSSHLLEADIEHSLGFVGCPRRFNVAVTRAQGLLVMVGDPLLLTHNNSWRQMMELCISQGAYRGPDMDTLLGLKSHA